MPNLKIALLCGGPSLERGISLNSARTVLDHLRSETIEILPIYFDLKKNAYLITLGQLYSNTPSDFDFKLKQTAKPLTQPELVKFLKKTDIVFPAMHGKFGEDGEIQKLLEKNNIPFIGSPSEACALAFNKHEAQKFIKEKSFYSLDSLLISESKIKNKEIGDFFKINKLEQAIVKPARSGSSIAVQIVKDSKGAIAAAKEIFKNKIDDRAILEPYVRGKEFTIIILQNKENQPVALIPTEIEIKELGQIFNYRKKYLASSQVRYFCPPRFSEKTILKIQTQAEKLFKLLGMRDLARFDGWILPDGHIWFSDFNPISGMEQNSFLFIQAARLGMTHGDLLNYVLKNACRRYGISVGAEQCSTPTKQPRQPAPVKKRINILFGGQTAERQVSVMSGTNVWLKLNRSSLYDPYPYLLDLKNNVWSLPYSLTLYHTVEEISENCQSALKDSVRLKKLSTSVIKSLKIDKNNLSVPWFRPKKMPLKNFIKSSPYIFIGLHGGMGENGDLQKMLEQAQVKFNGSGSKASKLCMNKFATGQALAGLEKAGVFIAKKRVVKINFLKGIIKNKKKLQEYWNKLKADFSSSTILVKPVDDGCSAGIARLYNTNDLKIYLEYALAPFNKGICSPPYEGGARGGLHSTPLSSSPLIKGAGGINLPPDKGGIRGVIRDSSIPEGTLTNQHGIIEMPRQAMRHLMFEEFITTDKVEIIDNKLRWKKNSGWIEITCGLLENRGELKSFNPSITVASGNVLTLEEKFQGGTGVNITPPPEQYVNAKAVKAAKKRIEITAKALGIKGYARIDAFMNIKTGELIIIEANTLPGLTPSTVIYHQALAEKPPLYPKEFLEKIIEKNY